MPTALEDKDAIRELLAEYCFRLDGARYDAMAELFTEDGTWETAFGEATGRAAIAAFARDLRVRAGDNRPRAAHAGIMERAGCEALFVGTGGVVGAYTGLADVGTATLSECIEIAGWIADSVRIPVIMDGDTGHGGIMAVRRMVRECIRRGIAGVRIDDQPIEGKRKTQDAGIEWCRSI